MPGQSLGRIHLLGSSPPFDFTFDRPTGVEHMPDKELDRLLFDRIWALGAKAVQDNHISALADATLSTPTLEEYQNSHGERMRDLINVIKLGILQLG
jgi:hypothetical protein